MDIHTLGIQRLFFWKAGSTGISILHSMHQRNKLCQLTMSMYCKWHIVARSKQETEGRGGLRPLSPKWLLLPTSQCNLKEGMSNVNTLESSDEVLTHKYMKNWQVWMVRYGKPAVGTYLCVRQLFHRPYKNSKIDI